jgi:hypothetical protein
MVSAGDREQCPRSADAAPLRPLKPEDAGVADGVAQMLMPVPALKES